MSECMDMTSMMAKELMLGIKDNVEDVSTMFKRMALLKPKETAWSAFTEKPQKKDETPLGEVRTKEPALEFTYGISAPESAPADIFKPVPLPAPAAKTSKSAVRKRKADEISEDQFLLFKIA